ncbi:enoyl-CoA hydratase-related protein [Pseudonocardia spinosispora]|uniref:enoyl-CoA hydratase-related protein n=1 Tax=Pseudonocardia spinosispora TaxID=103441 RepID=UPI0004278A98|nr:enoyl-CoA hydratase-related protein [Pseudonocardia spinosispora]
MSDDDDSIRSWVDAGVAHIELNRPEALNAWTPDMGRALLTTLNKASADPAVRAVLISGAGRAFSAGADVKNARELLPNGDPDLSGRLREIYNPIVLAVRSAPKPVIAAIHGACAGIGASLALACDLVLAAENAYLLMAFVRIGVMPDGGISLFLAERVGLTRAAQLTMLGDRLPARTALDWGLVTEIHPVDELMPSATALARRLAEGPTVALANIKRTLNDAAQTGLARHLELEATRQQEHGGTFDYAEGRAAFIEKRSTRFEGR